MSLDVSPEFAEAAAAPAYALLTLLEAQPRSGILRLTTWPMSVDVMGHTWTGLGQFGEIGELTESDDGNGQTLDVSLTGVDVGMRGFALGNPDDYQDRPITLWTALLDAATLRFRGAPVRRFAGVMDQMEFPARQDGKMSIGMKCRTASYDVRTNPAALRMNHVQHTARHPGERGMEYQQALIGNPSVTHSKTFQAYMWWRSRWGMS